MAKAVMNTSEGAKLDASAWVMAGLGQLAEVGIDGVKVEALAKRMGVTKGSFYWHFKDRETFLEAMLADWRRRATLDVIDRLERSDGPRGERLKRLMRLPITGKGSEWGADIELAIRLWGRSDRRARAALEEVDQVRLRYIGRLLVEAGISDQEAPARAVLAYSYIRVAATLVKRSDQDLMAECEKTLFS